MTSWTSTSESIGIYHGVNHDSSTFSQPLLCDKMDDCSGRLTEAKSPACATLPLATSSTLSSTLCSNLVSPSAKISPKTRPMMAHETK